MTVLKRIREWSRVPVIILSVRDQEEEKVAALDRLNRTQEAYDILASGVKRFPNQAQVHYDLACYACKIRLLNEAMSSLEKAIDVSEKDIRSMALNDPALEKLWVNISEI